MWECRICGGKECSRISDITKSSNDRHFVCDTCSAIFFNPDKFNNIIEVDVKYHDTDSIKINRLEKITVGDWIDLSSKFDTWVTKDEWCLIDLGVSIKLPEGYEAHILPRSSTFKNHGILIANSMGIIDNTYCGNGDIWKLSVYPTRNSFILSGNRICQFKIVRKQPSKIVFNTVENMDSKDRGGLGSTGL